MPIFQERCWQPEADIYALNKEGDVIIFEFKRDQVGSDAVRQALPYCEKAARFSYNELEMPIISPEAMLWFCWLLKITGLRENLRFSLSFSALHLSGLTHFYFPSPEKPLTNLNYKYRHDD